MNRSTRTAWRKLRARHAARAASASVVQIVTPTELPSQTGFTTRRGPGARRIADFTSRARYGNVSRTSSGTGIPRERRIALAQALSRARALAAGPEPV